jgi:hypothetical protein
MLEMYPEKMVDGTPPKYSFREIWGVCYLCNNEKSLTFFAMVRKHGCMARGGHGISKVPLRPAMPDPSMLCGWATPETASWPFQGWSACRAGGLRPSFTPLDNQRRTTMLENYDKCKVERKSVIYATCFFWLKPIWSKVQLHSHINSK